MKATFAACAIVVAATAIDDGQEDDRAVWQLIGQLGGLREDFSAKEFLDRPAMKELLLIDRAAIKPLEQALTTSQHWAIRASAAYLLTQLQEVSTLYASFKQESNCTVKAILFQGASARTAYTNVLEEEIAKTGGLGVERLSELMALPGKPLPLSEPEVQERIRRVFPLLESSDGGDQDLRAVRIIGAMPPQGLSTFLQRFESLRTESGRMKALEGLSANFNKFDPMNQEYVRAFIQNLDSLLSLIERTSADASALVRGRTMELSLTLARRLDLLDMDPDRALRVLRKLSQDKDAAYSNVADDLLAEWEKHLVERQKQKEAAKRKERHPGLAPPSPAPIVPHQPDSRNRTGDNPSQGAPSGEPADQANSGRFWALIGIVCVGSFAVWGLYRATRRTS